ncbi:MAG: NADP-dependent phosphogluconate dehydrogenase [Stappiaceae bacterium]
MAVVMSEKAQIGLIGLGTMGANLSLNIAEKGFPIAVFNRTTSRTDDFHAGAGTLAEAITPCHTLEAFVAAIQSPRAIILMVPAGEAVDAQIDALLPLLNSDDLIIDAGNANFHETNRRAAAADARGAPYLGIGVSGGEEGARHGPAIMGGGKREAWNRVAPVLEAIAARYEDTPCATWLGESGTGHFVKTVHNGIEYADMQMIAEIYSIMHDGYGMTSSAIGDVFAQWNEGPLKSYLIEISAEVTRAADRETGRPVMDIILDRAGQKGTGRWTVIEAQQLGAAIPCIEAAVSARNLSAQLPDRKTGEALFGPSLRPFGDGNPDIGMLERALIAGKILCYAQGFSLLKAAAKAYEWDLSLPDVARVWRAGCIIRSTMLNDMAAAFTTDPDTNLMFAETFSPILKENEPQLRDVVLKATGAGIPLPALASAQFYFDMMRTGRSSANMIQAQRDFFGAHSFERVDQPGSHHGPWNSGV